jgi:hypothetical protein
VAKARAATATPPDTGFKNLEIRIFTAIASTPEYTPQASTRSGPKLPYRSQISKTMWSGKRNSQHIVPNSSTQTPRRAGLLPNHAVKSARIWATPSRHA